jgi:hypothetical protein
MHVSDWSENPRAAVRNALEAAAHYDIYTSAPISLLCTDSIDGF